MTAASQVIAKPYMVKAFSHDGSNVSHSIKHVAMGRGLESRERPLVN